MKTKIGCAAMLLGAMGVATGATATADNNGSLAGKRGLSPITQAELNLQPGEFAMLIPDMPNVPPQNMPVMIAQANQAQASDVTTTRILGVCFPAPNQAYSGANGLAPIAEAGYYLQQYEHRNFDFKHPSGTVTILQLPKHGVLRPVTQSDVGTILPSGGDPVDPANPGYFYFPEQGYFGKDSATVLVDVGGIKVKVKYYFYAVDGLPGNESMEEYCGKTGPYWKISSTIDANGNSTITSVEYNNRGQTTFSKINGTRLVF
jgi:hypothetical protein